MRVELYRLQRALELRARGNDVSAGAAPGAPSFVSERTSLPRRMRAPPPPLRRPVAPGTASSSPAASSTRCRRAHTRSCLLQRCTSPAAASSDLTRHTSPCAWAAAQAAAPVAKPGCPRPARSLQPSRRHAGARHGLLGACTPTACVGPLTPKRVTALALPRLWVGAGGHHRGWAPVPTARCGTACVARAFSNAGGRRVHPRGAAIPRLAGPRQAAVSAGGPRAAARRVRWARELPA